MRVFISSTYKDLKEYRKVVWDRLGNQFSGMELFGSRPDKPRQVCIQEAADCDIYVGVFGERYGTIDSDTGISMTELEYRTALDRRIPILIYFPDRSVTFLPEDIVEAPINKQKLQELKNELSMKYVVSWFKDEEDLASKIANDITQVIEDKSLRQFRRILHNRAVRTVSSTSDEISIIGNLPRIEVESITTELEDNNAVLLVGDAGTGKTGIVKQFVNRLVAKDESVFIIRANELPKNATNLDFINAALPFEREPLMAIRRLSEIRERCYIIVDQLDTIVDFPISEHIVTFLQSARDLDRVKILAVTRSYEADKVPIKNLDFAKIESLPLTVNEAQRHLATLSIQNPSDIIQLLAQNLLDLSLMALLVEQKSGVDFNKIEDRLDLWDKYRENIEVNDGLPCIGCAVDWAKESFREWGGDFSVGWNPDTPTEKLLSRRVLIDAEGLRKRFRHEQIRDYFFAYGASLMDKLMPLDVINVTGEIRSRSVLQWMEQMYHRHMPGEEAKFVRRWLNV